MLVFEERGKPDYPEKTSRSRDENQQQTQPTYDNDSGSRTQATLVGGECSHHCAIPDPYTQYYHVSSIRVPYTPGRRCDIVTLLYNICWFNNVGTVYHPDVKRCLITIFMLDKSHSAVQ